MSQVSATHQCPVCELDTLKVEFDCRTSEHNSGCTNCGYTEYREIKVKKDGSRQWVETFGYPMDGECVRRPKEWIAAKAAAEAAEAAEAAAEKAAIDGEWNEDNCTEENRLCKELPPKGTETAETKVLTEEDVQRIVRDELNARRRAQKKFRRAKQRALKAEQCTKTAETAKAPA
jgi:hypothetical protein